MQPESQVLLALLLAHVLADFPFQTRRMVTGKHQWKARAYVAHLGVHTVTTLAVLILFTDVEIMGLPAIASIGLLIFGHAVLDCGKTALVRARPDSDGWGLFVTDQALHVAIVFVAASLIAGIALDWASLWSRWMATRERILVEGLVLATFVFPTGYLIRYLLRNLSRELGNGSGEDEGLTNAGLYLGWIERTLLMLAFMDVSLTAVGLIVGAKSLVRFPEFKTRAFAEYFLIGTLLSVSFAGIGALVLLATRGSI